MPRMPELKGKSVTSFQSVPIDTSTIPFKDKEREKKRQERLGTESEKKKKLSRPPKVYEYFLYK